MYKKNHLRKIANRIIGRITEIQQKKWNQHGMN